MTRKDYVARAAELRLSRPTPANPAIHDRKVQDIKTDRIHGFALAVEAVARALQKDNPRFDSERFYSAIYD